MNVEQNKIKQLVLSGLFLSLSIVTILLPIPIYGFISVDLSLAVILISSQYISLRYSFFITLVTPFFALFSYFPTDVIGVMILEVIFISSLLLFRNITKINQWFKATLAFLLLLIIIFSFNLLLFYPLYFNGWYMFKDGFWNYFLIVFAITFVSTFLRLIINLLIYFIFIKKINIDK